MKAADATLRALSGLNFSVAAMQAGFGPFVAVRLSQSGWDAGRIGLVLSAASIASVAAQVPSGMLIDRLGARRWLVAVAILGNVAGLLMLSLAPLFPLVLAAEIVQGGAAVGLSLAIAALTLCLARQEHLGERLGHNVRFAAVGAALGTAGLGLAGSALGARAVFLAAAAFGIPALVALAGIHPHDIGTAAHRTSHHAAKPKAQRRATAAPLHALLLDRAMVGLLACMALFQLANASLLPLAATQFAHAAARRADLFTAAAVIGPQLLAAALSPKVGRAAREHGRRIVLVLGLVAVPLRAIVFASGAPIPAMLLAQLLDGIDAAVIGVMIPLIVADITHRGGRFNFALGLAGVAGYAGATLSTSLAGAIADAFGLPAAFLVLAAAGLAAILVASTLLPETGHLPVSMQPASHARTAP